MQLLEFGKRKPSLKLLLTKTAPTGESQVLVDEDGSNREEWFEKEMKKERKGVDDIFCKSENGYLIKLTDI